MSRRSGSSRPGRRWRNDDGSSDALGLALIAPAAIGLALVILLISRGVDARATAQNAAEAAAQAAARERSFAAAQVAANRVGAAMLVDPNTCATPSVQTTVEGPLGFAPGGVVQVTVRCTASSRGLELVGGDATTASATAFAVIDTFRGVDE
ncbi:MAG: hypothetical protein AAFP84_16440 [Actinomycetota bacterium]